MLTLNVVFLSSYTLGGQYVNNARMAELHAQQAPDRVRELEAWGAVFDRTEDQKILQRNFGGHKYPRLAHVGDRTGNDDAVLRWNTCARIIDANSDIEPEPASQNDPVELE